MNSITRRVGLAAVIVSASVALLAACSVTPAPSASPSAAPTPTVGFTCAQALPAGTTGWAADASYVPSEGSSAAKAAALGGIACKATNTAGSVVTYSVAKPSSSDFAKLQQNAADSMSATAALGGQQGFFSASNAQVFAGAYWITAQSSTFSATAAAAPVIAQIINVLPAG